MHDDIIESIDIPENVNVTTSDGHQVLVTGPKGDLNRKFPYEIKVEGRKILMSYKNGTKNNKKMIKTSLAHIKNMMNGVIGGYNYTLQICTVHFPMTVTIVGKEVVVKNFLGEARARTAKILPKVDVKIEGDFVKIFSIDLEAAGQTAANIETATRVRNRDRRVFQDGIWITSKPGDEA